MQHKYLAFCRKWLAGITVCALCVSAVFCTPVSAASVTLGKVQNNDVVNATDALAILRAVVGLENFTPHQQLQADVNGDGTINSIDALQILRYVVGMPDAFVVPQHTAHTNDSVYLRAGAGTDYTPLTIIPGGDEVTVYGQALGGWCHVVYRGTEGYCAAQYVTLDNNTDDNPGSDTQTGRSAVTTGNLNMRSGPDTSYGVLVVIPAGTTVTVYGESENGWYRTSYRAPDGSYYEGYCSAQYLQIKSGSSGSTTGSVNYSLDIPYYRQTDDQWGDVLIGGSKIRYVGCLLTCLSMCESYRTGTTITPDALAGQYTFNTGGGLASWGETGYTISRNLGAEPSVYLPEVLSLLKAGKPAIVEGWKDMNGSGSHWVVVYGYHGDGVNLSEADFTVLDPGYHFETLADLADSFPVHRTVAHY